MNCKQGDLAVTVNAGTQKQFIGRVVKVVRSSDWYDKSWITEPELRCPNTNRPIHWRDAHLRPIRDQPGADESLTWCDVPS